MNRFSLLTLFTTTALLAAPCANAANAPQSWWNSVTFTTQIDAGATYNASSPDDRKNFGRLFDDKSDQVLLDQVLLTAQRPIDSSSKDYDFGFKLQGFYGSDARYAKSLHEFQNAMGNDTNQTDIVEANLQLHTPWFTSGGFDIKAGQYANPESAESLDPSNNYFYSHSYIYNFGVPFANTGILTTLHATQQLDIFAGIDTGENTFIGHGGDNNDAPAFLGGVGLTLLDGKLTSNILTHIGPEVANAAIDNGLVTRVDHNRDTRYLTDITTTWTATDKLTLVNDLNWIRDDQLHNGQPANAFGIAQYGIYALNDVWSLVGRAEVFRDINGAFVSQSGNNVDYIRSEEGLPALSVNSVGGGSTTYGALTAGLTIKPKLGLSQIQDFRIRPEIRYDSSLNGTHPFNDSKDQNMLTAGIDVLIKF